MQRDLKMDSIKGMLILLVVLGHCIEITENEGIMRILYNIIYSFHMPLFVFVSGYFTNLQKTGKKYFLSILNLLLIYCIFQVLKSIPQIGNLKKIILFPQWTWWYILSLVHWRVLFYVINKWCSVIVNLKLVVFFCGVSIVCGYLPFTYALSIQRTLFYSFPFVLGLFCREKQNIQLIYNANMSIVIISLCMSILAFVLIKDRDVDWMLHGCYSYSYWPISLKLCPLVRIAQIALSIIISISFIKYCPIKTFLVRIGKGTLFIYTYHTFVLRGLKLLDFKFNDIVFLVVELVVTFASLYVLNKISILHYLINPVNSIHKMFAVRTLKG